MAHSALVCEGYGDGFDDVIIQGDLDELRFVAFYTRCSFILKTNTCVCFLKKLSHGTFTYRSEEVVAVASMNYDPIVSRVAEVLGSGKTIKKRDVE